MFKIGEKSVKLIVGLGNPGKEYENNRHNFGFKVIDLLSKSLKIDLNKEKNNGLYGIGKLNNEKIILVKPLTYMNLSGDCVVSMLKYYKVIPQDLIVIYDDIDIPVGKIRVKPSGSPGTHNGMKDITKKLRTKEFTRVRVGSGKPQNGQDLAEYVLSNIKKDEKELIEKSFEDAAEAVITCIESGIPEAMNEYN
jgi:PTH1 family peptidyl-tRNA hydrolase